MTRPISAYYERFFPIERVWAWCAAPVGSRQEFCLFLNDHPVASHFTGDNCEGLLNTILRNRAERVEIGNRVNLQGQLIARRLAFDLDSNDYTIVYPGEGSTTAEDTGLIEPGAWLTMILSAGFLGQYLHKVCRIGMKTGDILRDYTFVFSGRRGVHLWVNSVEHDWINHEEIKDLVLNRISRLATAAGVRKVYNELKKPEYALDDWLSRIEEYAHSALSWATLWERGEKTIECLLPQLSILLGRPAEANNAFFANIPIDAETADFWRMAGLLLLSPRVDKGVTTSKSHLLKSPFSLHPATRLVALPLDPYLPETCVRDNICIPIDKLTSNNAADNLIRQTFSIACELFHPTD